MEPQIQYARTSDGVSIAFWTTGSGPVVIDLGAPPASHLRMELQIPEIRAWYERFAAHRTFVRLDGRGFGLSERNIDSYSVDSLVLDLEAVVESLAMERFTLVGAINSGLAAVKYAACHPERVDALVLWCAYARGEEFFDDSGTLFLRDAIDRDLGMFTESASHSRFGWTHGEHARRFAELWRAAVTPPVQALVMDGLHTEDVTALLPSVTAPTLVLQREARGVDVAMRIAAAMPNARVVIVDGASAAPYLDDADMIWKQIADFIGIEEPVLGPGRATSPDAAGTAVILFTDIADSTGLTERLGDVGFRERARALDDALRAAVLAGGGTVIDGKLLGDGVLAVFGSARHAIDAAVACGAAGASGGLPLHLGLHAGDVIREEGNVYGGAVNIAARICALSAPGELLVSGTVRELARTSAGVTFEDRGEHALKGIEDAVRVWRVVGREIVS